MKKLDFLIITLIFLVFTVNSANKNPRNINDPSFITEQKFSKAQCEILNECKSCSFLEVKELKECLVSGFVTVKKCTKINSVNNNDKFDYHLYEPCNMEGFNFKWVHLFVVDCFLMMVFFVICLNNYKNKLENKLYERL